MQVAEKDLEIRGAGDFLGTRQPGLPRFRFGNILRDFRLMEHARTVAAEVVDHRGLAAATDIARRLLDERFRDSLSRD